MDNWEIFEIAATNFLNNYFKSSGVRFDNDGGTNSTVSDIQLFKDDERIANIEAKYSPSQAGQIVLLFNNDTFVLSEASKNIENDFTHQIIEYMNQNYQTFKDVGTSGISINIDQGILFNWVKQTYQDKGSNWIIASTKYQNLLESDLLLVPIMDIDQYFNISATFRRKRSGTAHLPQSRVEEFKSQFNNITTNYTLNKDGKKYKLKTNINIPSLTISNDYFLSRINQSEYYVKKRSLTNNANVVFSLVLNETKFQGAEFRGFFHL